MKHPIPRIPVKPARIPISWLSRVPAPALILGAVLFMGPTAKADVSEPPVAAEGQTFIGTVQLADLIDQAYTHNPSIQQAREAWRATVENYRITTGYPNPQLMVTWFPEPIETRLGPQDWNARISQMIPFPGKLSKAGELVAADVRIARLKLDMAVKETLLALRESYSIKYLSLFLFYFSFSIDLFDLNELHIHWIVGKSFFPF